LIYNLKQLRDHPQPFKPPANGK
ncbi:hypothetical protein ABKN59_011976, partial [Abortiporus biennis]